MLKPERNSTYAEVKAFLDDVYMHLCNERQNASAGSCDDIEKLVERCKEITQLFEMSYDTSPSNYLVMSSIKTQSPSSEYVDVIAYSKTEAKSPTKSSNSNPSNTVNCPSTDQPDDSLQTCPFSGLPAAHLTIKQSPVFGHLSRLEKRMFFEQTKKYYAGLLDDWLLLYGGGSTDLRPSVCIQLSDCEIVDYQTEDRKRLYTFQIVMDGQKKHIFQANSQADMRRWIDILSKAVKSEHTTTPHANSERKLPNLPEPIHYINASHDSEMAEDIYDEPGVFYHSATENKYDDDDDNDQPDDTYDNVSACRVKVTDADAPAVPNKQSNHDIALAFEYDIPKSPPPPVQPDDGAGEKLEINDDKFRDVKSKLATHLMTGISPERKKPKYQMQVNNLTSGGESNDKKIKSDAKSPVKDWFLNRLSKSSSKVKNKSAKSECVLESNIVPKPTMLTPSRNTNKGERINKIINQLEANGHLPIISKCLNERRNTICDVDDSCNYEPIMASGN